MNNVSNYELSLMMQYAVDVQMSTAYWSTARKNFKLLTKEVE